ncbi:MAG: glycosyltransferase family 4 protein [Pseudomonadota bacterium]
MRVLVLHNRYRVAGGEDVAVAAEVALLGGRGHDVTLVEVDNADIAGPAARAGVAFGTPYRPARRRWARQLAERVGAQVVHVHNFFPLLSPSVIDGARDAGAAVVQTLHNYRAICANGLLMRDGGACELCVGRIGWPALRHRCYRGSLVGSAAVVAVQQAIRRGGLWDRPGTRLIALTHFARAKLIAGGLPGHRLVIKPNFVVPVAATSPVAREGVLFVGRLSPEKGVDILLQAARRLPHRRFTVVGGGDDARSRSMAPANVTFTGPLPGDAAREAMACAALLVMPSLWYEGFPLTLIEAMARATPVIASRIGSLAELIEDGVTGRLVPPGDPAALAEAIEAMLADPAASRRIGEAGKAVADSRYDPASNGARLEDIYREAIAEAKPS